MLILIFYFTYIISEDIVSIWIHGLGFIAGVMLMEADPKKLLPFNFGT